MSKRPSVVARLLLGATICLGIALAALCRGSVLQAQDHPVYKDATVSEEARLDDLIQRLTLDEKISLLGGTGFTTQAIGRLGIPALKMTDGPLGVRWGKSTVLPGGPLTAATWDPAIMQNVGKVIGEEVMAQPGGETVILGPGVNIHRTPFNGRNGEYFSEDPFLAGVTAASYVKGVQGAGAAATVKHYACNNQEDNRNGINVHVSDRALREIYLPAFKAAVQDGGALCIMDSYNLVNGPHASESDYLLNEVLKKEWGFQGLVMSDWGGVHSAFGSVAYGNDLEMPTGWNVNPGSIKPLLAQGKLTEAIINDHVRRILRVVIRLGLLDGTSKRLPESTIAGPEHLALVQQAAEKGIILLKNEKVGQAGMPVLPIDRTKVKRIAVIGMQADQMPGTIGGSAWVTPKVPMTTPLAGIKALAGTGITVEYAAGTRPGGNAADRLPTMPGDYFTPPAGTDGKGLLGEYFTGTAFAGTPVLKRVDAKLDFTWTTAPGAGLQQTNFSVRWSGQLTAPKTGTYTFGLWSDDGSRMSIDGKQVVDNWGDHGYQQRTGTIALTEGQSYKLVVEYYQGGGESGVALGWKAPAGTGAAAPTTTGDPNIDAAVALAAKSDVAVVCVGTTSDDESEGHDRNSLALPRNQDMLVSAVMAANPRTIVVLFSGGVLVPGDWVSTVPALLQAYYPGQQGGLALARILFGEVNPSGRLPDTMGKKREDFSDYPYFPGSDVYTEGIYVGYRHFDKENIEPLFCFGHGLSYTTFKYTNLKLTPDTMTPDGKVTVTLDVQNTGKVAGEEVVQLYVHDPEPRIDKAPKELKGFTRVALKPGEKKPVTLTLDARALCYADSANKRYQADAGVYEVQVGASSRDIRVTGRFKLADPWSEAVPGMNTDGLTPK
jgi:beta-glucosidase